MFHIKTEGLCGSKFEKHALGEKYMDWRCCIFLNSSTLELTKTSPFNCQRQQQRS